MTSRKESPAIFTVMRELLCEVVLPIVAVFVGVGGLTWGILTALNWWLNQDFEVTEREMGLRPKRRGGKGNDEKST